MRKIAEGAEAIIYKTSLFGLDMAVKSREPKQYRVEALDLSIRRHRTKKEAKILALVGSLRLRAPRLLLIKRYQIYMHYIEGNRLSQIADNMPQQHMAKHIGQAGCYLAALHKANIVHGDYTMANLIVNGDAVYLIDFGLSEITNAVEDKAIDLLLMKRSIPRALYRQFIKHYKSNFGQARAVIGRLAEIEKRGRYQQRSLQNVSAN